MGSVWKALQQPSATRRAVLMPLGIGVLSLTLSPLLIAAHMALLGQLVAGLAVVPLTFTIYLCLLVTGMRPDGNGGGGSSGGDGKPNPPPPGTPGDGVDWERFEREFRAYADQRVLVR
jgi:hypothetical protein